MVLTEEQAVVAEFLAEKAGEDAAGLQVFVRAELRERLQHEQLAGRARRDDLVSPPLMGYLVRQDELGQIAGAAREGVAAPHHPIAHGNEAVERDRLPQRSGGFDDRQLRMAIRRPLRLITRDDRSADAGERSAFRARSNYANGRESLRGRH